LQGKLSVGVKTLQINAPDETASRGLNGISSRFLPDRTLTHAGSQAPDGKSGRRDGLGGIRNGPGTNMAYGVGATRSEHAVDGVAALPQVRPRPERRGGAGDVGGEPVLAVFKRDEVLRAPSADRGVEPESMAHALGQSGSREAIGGDAQGGAENETDPASATGEDQRGHNGAGEAREVSNRQQALRSSQREAGKLGQAAQAQTEAELRAGGEAVNAQTKPLRPCSTVQESGQMREATQDLARASDTGYSKETPRTRFRTEGRIKASAEDLRSTEERQRQSVQRACAGGGMHQQRQSAQAL